MARMMDDASRAKLLSSLLDQNIGQPLTRGQSITDDDVEEEDPSEGRSAPPVDPRGAPPPMPGNGMAQGGPQQSPIQPIPGQPGMVAVPATLAQQAMQMLMQQGSANATGKAMGANGQTPMPTQEEEEA